jgi:hypothetical protein
MSKLALSVAKCSAGICLQFEAKRKSHRERLSLQRLTYTDKYRRAFATSHSILSVCCPQEADGVLFPEEPPTTRRTPIFFVLFMFGTLLLSHGVATDWRHRRFHQGKT